MLNGQQGRRIYSSIYRCDRWLSAGVAWIQVLGVSLLAILATGATPAIDPVLQDWVRTYVDADPDVIAARVEVTRNEGRWRARQAEYRPQVQLTIEPAVIEGEWVKRKSGSAGEEGRWTSDVEWAPEAGITADWESPPGVIWEAALTGAWDEWMPELEVDLDIPFEALAGPPALPPVAIEEREALVVARVEQRFVEAMAAVEAIEALLGDRRAPSAPRAVVRDLAPLPFSEEAGARLAVEASATVRRRRAALAEAERRLDTYRRQEGGEGGIQTGITVLAPLGGQDSGVEWEVGFKWTVSLFDGGWLTGKLAEYGAAVEKARLELAAAEEKAAATFRTQRAWAERAAARLAAATPGERTVRLAAYEQERLRLFALAGHMPPLEMIAAVDE